MKASLPPALCRGDGSHETTSGIVGAVRTRPTVQRTQRGDFQRRGRALLSLIEAKSGPVLEDFDEDPPGQASGNDTSGWVYPVELTPMAAEVNNDTAASAQALLHEIGQMRRYDLALAERGRTTVGASALDIEDIAQFERLLG